MCHETELACRVGCGACCIAPSISSPIPGMPNGKPAGVRCAQLTADNRCALFGRPERPAVCASLRPSREMCGANNAEALLWLTHLEQATAPPAGEPMNNSLCKAAESPLRPGSAPVLR